jgi:subtilisin family serine protease
LPQQQVAATTLNPSPTNANIVNKANDIGRIAVLFAFPSIPVFAPPAPLRISDYKDFETCNASAVRGVTKKCVSQKVVLLNDPTSQFALTDSARSIIRGRLSSLHPCGHYRGHALPTANLVSWEDLGIEIQAQQDATLIRLDQFRADPRFAGINGAGQTVAVIDTGIDLNHPFFGPDANGNGIADRIVFSWDYSGSNDSNASDLDGHG